DRERWIPGRAFPPSAYLAGAAAAVVVTVRWTGLRWARPLWGLLAAFSVVRVVSGTNLPLDLVVAYGTGLAAGSGALLAVGSPDLAPRRRRGGRGPAPQRPGRRLADRAAARGRGLPLVPGPPRRGERAARGGRRRPQRQRPRPRPRRPPLPADPVPHRVRGRCVPARRAGRRAGRLRRPVARPARRARRAPGGGRPGRAGRGAGGPRAG